MRRKLKSRNSVTQFDVVSATPLKRERSRSKMELKLKRNSDIQYPAAEEIIVRKEKEEAGEGEIAREELEKTNPVKTAGIDIPSFPISAQRNNSNNCPGVICIIERASLEIAKVGKSYQLLHAIKHRSFLKRNGRNPADYRPDIAHLAILAVLDAQLNLHGLLKALYVKTEKGLLIEIKPHVRIPRIYDGFAGLMIQLLQEFTIKASGSGEELIRTIKNPVTQYLPVDSLKIGFSSRSEKRVLNMQDYLAGTSSERPLVFVLGAMAHGRMDADYVDEFICFDEYPVSASTCISMSFGDVYRQLRYVWKWTAGRNL